MAKNVTLKPFRQYDGGYDVVNLFAHVSGDVDKGTVVALDSANYDQYSDYEVLNHAGSPFSDLKLKTAWTVKDATSADKAYGILLNDVRTTGSYGQDIRFGQGSVEAQARDLVPSGCTVPILTKGIVTIAGFSGSPGAGSGAVVDPNAAGKILVVNGSQTSGLIGTFLTSKGSDGFAVLHLGKI